MATTGPNQIRQSWRPDQVDSGVAGRFLKRIVTTLAGLALVGWLLYLLLSPFWHPNAYLVVLAEPGYAPESHLPLPMGRRDMAFLQELGDRFALLPWQKKIQSTELNSKADALQILRDLESHPFESTDVLVVLIRAQGLMLNGEPVVECRNFNVASPAEGTMRFSELVRRIENLRPTTKLLLFDVNGGDYEPRLGQLEPAFLKAVSEQVRLSKDIGLWMLTSHDSGEQPQISPTLQSSLFSFWLRRGLRGWADANRDSSVDVGELHTYIRDNIKRAAAFRSSGMNPQTPQLVRGGGAPIDGATPTLVSNQGFRASAEDSVVDAVSNRGAVANSDSDEDSEGDESPDDKADPEPGLLTSGANILAGKVNTLTGSLGDALGFKDVPALPDGSIEEDDPADPEADKNSDTAKEAGGASNTEKEVESKPKLVNAFDLVASGWDSVGTLNALEIRPLDVAPHLWRELIRELHWHESYLLESPDRTAEVPSVQLTRLKRALERLANGKRVPDALDVRVGELSRLMRAAADARTGVLTTDRSVLKFLEGTKLASAWAEENKSKRETVGVTGRLLFQLAESTDLPEDLIRLAISTSLQAESSGVRASATQGLLAVADGTRLNGERMLFDRTRSDWPDFSRQSLQEASRTYSEIESHHQTLRRGQRLHNDILIAIPDYMRLRHDLAADSLVRLMTAAELSRGIRDLDELRSAIESRDSERVATQVRVIQGFHDRLKNDPQQAFDLLLQYPNANLASIGVFSRSTAVSFRSRLRANLELNQRDQLIWQQFDDGAKPASSVNSPVDTEKVTAEHIALEAQLLLSISNGLRRTDRFDELGSLAELPNGTTPAATDLEAAQALLATCNDALPTVLRRTLESVGGATNKSQLLERCLTTYEWMDLRDLGRVDDEPLRAAVDDALKADAMRLQYARLMQALRDARPTDRPFLEDEWNRLRFTPSVNTSETAVGANELPTLSLNGPDVASLVSVSERTVKLELASSQPDADETWVVLDYNDACLSVESTDHSSDYRWQLIDSIRSDRRTAVLERQLAEAQEQATDDLRDKAQELSQALIYPVDPNLAGVRRSLVLEAGRSREITFRLKRKVAVGPPAKLIVKVISASDYRRHEIAVPMPKPPSIQLTARGLAEMMSPVNDGIVLHPLPNQPARFDLSLNHNFKKTVTYDLTLLAPTESLPPSMPIGMVDRQRARDIFRSLGKTQTLARRSVVLPADSELPLMPMFAGLVGQPKSDASEEPPTVAKEKKEPPPVESDYGLVLRIDDPKSGDTIFRRIVVAPQRPQRFLTTSASFDIVTRRLTIVVRAISRDVIPEQGLQILARVRAKGTTKDVRLTGVIEAPRYEAKLSSVVPSLSTWADVSVDVDQYPRAFRLSVPCSQSVANFDQPKDQFEVRLTSPTTRQQFKAPTDTIDVSLEVDAPSGSFPFQSVDGDYVDVGLDVDRDREFRDEKPVRLKSDRAVRISSILADEYLGIEAKISDFRISVPTGRLQGIRANLLARMVSGQRQVWSDPVEVILDGSAPQILRVGLSPDRVVRVGKSLEASVLADDRRLSGVGLVELAVDKDFDGKFPEKPVKAKFAGGVWTAKIPFEELEPGVYDLMVRATDLVGNQSDVKRVPVNVLEPSKDPKADVANLVSGRLTYDDEAMANASVTLTLIPKEDEDKNPATKKKAKPTPIAGDIDKEGNFIFKAVPPGRYLLKSSGLARNKPRLDERAIVVRPRPGRPTRVRVNIK